MNELPEWYPIWRETGKIPKAKQPISAEQYWQEFFQILNCPYEVKRALDKEEP